MARKTENNVLHNTPEKTVRLTEKNTKEKERQKNRPENRTENRTEKRSENRPENGSKNKTASGTAVRSEEHSTIFDDVFKTIHAKLPELSIPLINEVFGTTYPPDAKIIRCRDEYRTSRGKRLVDVHFQIGSKRYHLECQIESDGKMVIRMWEYDAAIALEHVEMKNGRYRICLPNSCVLQLRGKHQFDEMEMDIVLPDGQEFTYSVPVIWLSDYTSDKLLQKRLLFLFPFYIIRYEKKIHRLETDQKYLDEMLAEYRKMEECLEEELLKKGRETAYRDMIELINKLADNVLRDSDKVKQEVESVMGGKVLKLQTDYLIEQGEKIGEERGVKIGEERGVKIGEKRGEERGVKRINDLYRRLFEDGRSGDLHRAITDAAFQQKLLKEYRI